MDAPVRDRAVRAKAGLALVAVGAVYFVFLVSIAGLTAATVGRCVVILGLCYLCLQGRRWASMLLGALTIIPGAFMVVTALQLGPVSLDGLTFLAGALFYLGGFGLYFFAGGSRLFAPAPEVRPTT